MKYIVLSILLIASCNYLGNNPNEEMALEKVKEKKFNNARSKRIFDVVEFHKVNGESLNIFGQDVYRFKYRLVVKFKLNAHNLFRDNLSHLITDAEIKEEARKSKYNFDYNNYYHYKSGEIKEVNGVVEFKKTENGWE